MKKKALSTLIEEDYEDFECLSKNYSEIHDFSENRAKNKEKSYEESENSCFGEEKALPKEKKRENMEKEFKIKKKIKKDPLNKQHYLSNEENKHKMNEKELIHKKTVQITLPNFNINKFFYDILSFSNKDEDFLMMISNILTTGSRQLVKKSIFLKIDHFFFIFT